MIRIQNCQAYPGFDQMRLLFSLICLLLLSQSLLAQHVSALSGKIVDAETNQPLPFVSVRVNNTLLGTISDSLGNFSLKRLTGNTSLTFTQLGYERTKITLNSSSAEPLLIRLYTKAKSLGEVVITSNKTQAIANTVHTSVLDYDFIGDNIILITFQSRLDRCKLTLVTPNRDTLDQIPIPARPERLYRDCLGELQIVCKDSVYQVHSSNYQLNLLYAEPRLNFDKMMANCAASDESNLYFGIRSGSQRISMSYFQFYSNNHAIDYVQINKISGRRKPFTSAVDKDAISMAAIEQEHSARAANSSFDYEARRVFAHKIWMKEIFSPLIKLTDSLYLIDGPQGYIKCFATGGIPIRQVRTNFHREKDWKTDVMIDQKMQLAYSSYETLGVRTVKRIDFQSGQTSNTTEIAARFPENVKVNDGYIYYLFRHPGTNDNFLSRIPLN